MNVFYRIEKPWILFLETKKGDFDDLLINFRNEQNVNNVAVLLRGGKMRDVNGLFNEFSSALQFPSYFGENWNAFHECVNDLGWMPADNYVLGINDVQELLMDAAEEDLRAFFDLLEETCDAWSKPLDLDEEWGRKGKPFHVILQYERENKPVIEKRFSAFMKERPDTSSLSIP